MTWTNSLENASLKSLTSQAITDGAFTYSEVLNLLQNAAQGGISTIEFSDLSTIYKNSVDLFSNNYVKTITYNVILGNPANATWWGGAKQISDTEVLGNLAAGSPQLHAERLIGKWFLGLDLPMPLVGGDTANSAAASGVFSYGPSTGALFVNGITATDVNQGIAGTCYLMAALGAIAYNSPEYIQDSFIDNGNGTYGVRVYYNDQLTYTTVNTSLMVENNNPNKVVLAQDYSSGGTLGGEMWVGLLEKAYAQLNSQVKIEYGSEDWSKENSIQAIEGGMAAPIKQFTNLDYDLYSLYSYYNPYGQTYSSSDPGTHKQAIIEALASGGIGFLGAFKTHYNDSGQKTLIGGHAHMVLGYNATTDKFIIRNPWGKDPSNSSRVIQFEMAIEEFWNADTNPYFAISTTSASSEISYNYSLLATASTTETAVTEGESIVFTVTRDGTGTESTVFLDLSAGTAGTDDYEEYGRFQITFEKHESSKRYSLKTYKDSTIEGVETYDLNLYNKKTDVVPAESLTLYIKDVATSEFGYTLSSSAQSANSAVLEGENITFTITRAGTGSESTIYLNTAPGSALDNDYVSLKAQAVTFNAYETTKTIDVRTIQDGDSESLESFRLNLTKNPGDTAAVTSALGHIKDPEVPYFDYTVTSSAGSPSAAVEEGGTITFTIARSGSGFESTVFIETENITAATNDYAGLQLKPITFSKNQKLVTVQIETSTDEWLDTTEYFNLNVYRNETDKAPVSYGTGFIKEKTVTTYDYTITNDATESSPATEGQTITFRIERSGTGTASTVYVSTDNRTATGDDYVSVYKQAVEFASHETVKTFSIETTTDTLEEEVELFELELFRNKTDSYAAAYSEAYITNKVTKKDYSYTITSTSSTESPATEGEDITFTITRNDTGSASTVYLYTGGGTADDSGEAVDYKSITKLPLAFSSFETEKTVTITTYKDSLSEPDEYFWLNLYKTSDTADANYSAYAKGVIKDDSSASDFTYTVSSNSTSASAVEEGEVITFTITRSGTGSSSTVYLSTSGGTADFEGDGIDYEPLDKLELTFGAYETTKTVSVATYTDSADENKEYFWLDLYKTNADVESGDYAAYASGYLKNAAVQTDYSYTVTSNADKDNPVSEDNYVTFTVTRTGTGSESAVYVKTIAGTASDDGNNPDYFVVNRKIEFESFETTKTVKVRTWADSAEEGNEYFYLELYKSYADLKSGSTHTYASGGIKDWVPGTDYGYTITSSASTEEPALEGNPITFTITRSGSGTASKVYLKTLASLASEQGDEKDYEPLDMVALDFAAFETVKTITVDTAKDSRVEGYENLYLLLFKNYSDYPAWLNEEEGKLGSWALGVISDKEEVNPYSYTIESSADRDNPVAEGSPITFTISRAGSGDSSFVYLRTGGGTAEGDGDDQDYAGFNRKLVSFTKEETSKTITIDTYEDGATEGDEYYWAVLYKTFTDLVDDNYEAYTTGGIKDASGDSPTYVYTISSSAASDGPATEGSTVTFTISRDASAGASTVYVSTSPGTAEASNFDYQAISPSIINFLDGESTKTVTVETLKDEEVEDTEYFWLLLFKNLADAESGDYASYVAANIKDAPVQSTYTYTVTSAYSLSSPTEEGTSITFTITRDGSDSASTVYVSTNAGTAKSSLGDYEGINEKAVVFNVGETEKTVTVDTYVDSESEEAEYFHLLLYKTLADSANFDYTSYAEGGIKDLLKVGNYGYSITSNSPSNNQTNEGGSIVFTITRDGSGAPSTVFVSTHAATASSSDYKELKEFPVNFASDETTKTVTVETLIDTLVENEKAEYFHLLLYKSISDSQDFNYAAHRAAYIRDAVVGKDYDYTITQDPALVLEGGVITFTITRDDSGTPSTVHVRTRYNTADSEDGDYQHVALAIEFAADEVSKEVKVKTWSDTKTEGDEYFNINLYKTLADQEVYNWSTYSGAWIRDADFGYSIVGSSELYPDSPIVLEGSPLTITITRSGTGQATTVYLKIVNLTAIEGEDFATMTGEQLTVSFAADEGTKTIQINTLSDTKSEGAEYFGITLYRNEGDYASDSSSYINSLVVAIADNTAASTFSSLVSAPPTTPITQGTDSQLGTIQTAINDQGTSFLLGSGSSFHGHNQGMFKNHYAFAAIDNNGKVIVWGDALNGGNNSAVSDDLTNVVTIASNSSAFAALRQDGSVVTWGDAQNGGNINDISSFLNGSIDVKEIFSTKAAFAALRSDGSVVTWGDNSTGGDSQSVATRLNGSNDVIKIVSNMSAFAAIHTDGSVTTWGFASFGGDSSSVDTQLDGSVNVAAISITGSAFAALREDGSVITWGNQLDGGDSSTISTQINGDIDVTSIHSATAAFAAIRTDGSVITWGDINNGGDSSAISSAINGTINITDITATDSAFAALRSDGSVVTWGNSDFGGDSSGVLGSLNGTISVVKIVANKTSFAALKEDGSVVTWGYPSYGGDLGDNASKLNGDINVISITANDNAFAAIRTDGSVVTWGGFQRGGDSTLVETKINGTVDVIKIFSTSTAFAALRSDGSLVTWGDWRRGGDSTSLSAELNSIVSLSTIETTDAPTVTVGSVPSFFGTTEDSFINTTGKISASDSQGDTLLYNLIGGSTSGRFSSSQGKYGTLNIDTKSGAWNFSPNDVAVNAFSGRTSETFQVNVSDGISSVSSTLQVDIVVGKQGNGTPANDFIIMKGTNTDIDGGLGIDTALYSGNKDNYEIVINDGLVSVTDPDGNDSFKNIERIGFSNLNVATDLDGNAGQAAKLLGILLGPNSVLNTTYTGLVIQYLDSGISYESLMQIGLDAVLGADATSRSVISLIYQNLAGADAPESILSEYSAIIDSGSMTAVGLTLLAADHSINEVNIDLVGLSQTGLDYLLA